MGAVVAEWARVALWGLVDWDEVGSDERWNYGRYLVGGQRLGVAHRTRFLLHGVGCGLRADGLGDGSRLSGLRLGGDAFPRWYDPRWATLFGLRE